MVVAVSFHRERVPVAGGAPTGESERCLARLVATLPLVLLAVGVSAFTAWRQRDIGGLTLGVEPGRTDGGALHGRRAGPARGAHGARRGDRGGHRPAYARPWCRRVPLLFVLWFVTSVYWLFADRGSLPSRSCRSSRCTLHAGPPSADPLSFPAHWLLEAPGEFSQQWTRVFVSDGLAWWHAVWLLGLSLLWLSVALPSRPARRPLLVVGTTLAVLGVGAQYLVLL